METDPGATRESPTSAARVHIPRTAFALLSQRCAAVGSDGVRSLREAGYRAGVAMAEELPGDPASLPVTDFWLALSTSLETAGLGEVRFEGVSASIGAVAWTASPEAASSSAGPGARCHFAAGILAGVLRQVAGKTVDVLEIRCGAGGDRSCWFLFGTVASMRAVQAAARELGARASRRPRTETAS